MLLPALRLLRRPGSGWRDAEGGVPYRFRRMLWLASLAERILGALLLASLAERVPGALLLAALAERVQGALLPPRLPVMRLLLCILCLRALLRLRVCIFCLLPGVRSLRIMCLRLLIERLCGLAVWTAISLRGFLGKKGCVIASETLPVPNANWLAQRFISGLIHFENAGLRESCWFHVYFSLVNCIPYVSLSYYYTENALQVYIIYIILFLSKQWYFADFA